MTSKMGYFSFRELDMNTGYTKTVIEANLDESPNTLKK